MAIAWLGKLDSVCMPQPVLIPRKLWQHGQGWLSGFPARCRTCKVDCDVVISTGRRIASRLDRRGHGRSTALVRSSSLLAPTWVLIMNSPSFFKGILLPGQDCRRRFMVHFYHSSVLSPLFPLWHTLTRRSNVFPDICDHAS